MHMDKENAGEASSNIRILFEDADVVVVDKPAGVLMHGDGSRGIEGTIAGWHQKRTPDVQGVGEPIVKEDGHRIEKPGVVHRLDQDTSGVLILAKHQRAYEHLKAEFHDRRAKKEYRTFVHGMVKDERGRIERPIGRSRKDFRLRSAQRGAQGTLRPAVTRFERLLAGKEHSYLSVFPETGRTHQIRVHLKAINHPIVCDALYAPKLGCALGFSHLALHAYALTITLPNGRTETFTAPLPLEFLAAEQALSDVA